jgi:hypothetical protein
MQYPVSHINIGFKTGPEKHKQINEKPEIAMGFKESGDIVNKMSGKYQGSDERYHGANNQIGDRQFKCQQ